MDKIDELLTRGVANIIPSRNALQAVLESGKKINIYIGIDPTATHIHIGHAMPLRKLQQLAEMGHNVTFLIGDFTALIGDTSDKDTERPTLTPEEIKQNFETYKSQAEKVLDFSKVKVVHNSDWLSKLVFTEIVKLTKHFSLNDFISRELIRKRLDQGKSIKLHEVLYPVMQGYDSYFLDTDLQLGGTDQTFNMQAGRTLQKDLRNKESFVMTNEFLLGTDGRKMSKSWGNAIWLDDTPNDMYAKIMSIGDELIVPYFTLATNMPVREIDNIEKDLKEGKHPLVLKQQLAYQIVWELYDNDAAEAAQEAFKRNVQGGETPVDIEVFTLDQKSMPLIDILVQTDLAESKAEAKRLIEQGGVEVDGERMSDTNESVEIVGEKLIKVGKRRFAKITYNL